MSEIKFSLVISTKNRGKLLRRSLIHYNKQTFKEFEIIVVDDMSTDPILDILKEFNFKWQYIKMDSHKNDFPIYWGPSLSNNIGFKAAKGEVIGIAGPEILMKETAIEYAHESAMKDTTPYGLIYNSGEMLTTMLDRSPNLINVDFNNIIKLPTATQTCITKNTFYWFFCASKKEHIMKMNGCDEEYMRGICGDDDDFANRINVFAPRIHDHRIIGIHQNHSLEDRKDPLRIRRNNTWEKARLLNTKYLDEWQSKRNSDPIANKNRDWGSDNLIISKTRNYD